MKKLNEKNIKGWIVRSFGKSVGEPMVEKTLFRMTMRLKKYIFKYTGVELDVEISWSFKYKTLTWNISSPNLKLTYSITFHIPKESIYYIEA